MSEKKTVLFVSNSCLSNTGFGKNSKTILKYLEKTNKYNVVEMCIGGIIPFEGDPSFNKTPWKTYGSLPRDKNLAQQLCSNQEQASITAYGYHGIDDVVKDCKPDCVIFVEDPWAGGNLHTKPWWDKIPCLFWTTVDSTPILNTVQDQVSHMQDYAVWADFAKEEIEKLFPDKTIQLLYGAIPLNKFFPIKKEERAALREKFGIQPDEFVVFMNSRNQMRKYFYTNIEAVAKLNNRAEGKYKFLVNTNFLEGWPLLNQCDELGLKREDLLCSYVCSNCKNFHVSQHIGDALSCPYCGAEKTFNTPSVAQGLTDEDLNLLYNISDYYSLPISSGGFEITILEALAAGLPVGTIEYSSGSSYKDAPYINFYNTNFYKEFPSNFLKAQVDSNDVFSCIASYAALDDQKKKKIKKENKNYALKKFDSSITCKKIEKWIDKSRDKPCDFNFEKINNTDVNTDCEFDAKPGASNEEYVNILFKEILNRLPDPKGKNNWLHNLNEGMSREQMFNILLDQARQIKNREVSSNLSLLLDNESKKKKLGYIMPGGVTECIDSLAVINGLTEKYPLKEWDYYFVTDPKCFECFNYLSFGKCIPYIPAYDNFILTEGIGDQKGLFDIAFAPYITTQKIPYSLHHGKYK